jgi:hypothetical protein
MMEEPPADLTAPSPLNGAAIPPETSERPTSVTAAARTSPFGPVASIALTILLLIFTGPVRYSF